MEMNASSQNVLPDECEHTGGADNTTGLGLRSLAECPVGTMLDERGLARALNVSARSIRRMVDRCELPAGVRLGSRKIWLSERVLAFLADRADLATREAKKQAARLRQ